MKVPECTGKWIEMTRSLDADDEIIIHVPTSIWAGWTVPIRIKEDDLAAFLGSIGWNVALPQSARPAEAAMK